MNVEANSAQSSVGVAQRAAVHAALADVSRLAIVDALTLGDATPSELGAALGLPSNLLAHHLRILEKVGLINRARSEGDGRRFYLSLNADALDPIRVAPTRPVTRIVFVCSANSARSQLAAALWRGVSAIPATSAGTHPADRIAPGAVEAARRHGLPLRRVRPRHLDEVVADRDLLITVCDNAHEELDTRPDLHWSVPDPVRVGDARAFDAALDELDRRVTALAPRLVTDPAA
jgi:protein-tyrosine-phosphatase/DNA-binding HxlR family transcriptional regulator